MVASNPALDALKELGEENMTSLTKIADSSLPVIVNGIMTCGPIISAALSWDSLEIDKDINEMLNASKNLIAEVLSELQLRSILLTENERAAVNGFCLRVVSENWRKAEEVYDDWTSSIVNSLLAAGISSESGDGTFLTQPGKELSARIFASGRIMCALQVENVFKPIDQLFPRAIKTLTVSVDKAVSKLTQFHIPYEDAESIHHHLMRQASDIFVSVIARESKIYRTLKKSPAHLDNPNSDEISFDEIVRQYSLSMDSFVTSIYVNSRMVN